MQFQKQEFILLMKKSKLQEEFQNVLLGKGHRDKTSDHIKFYLDGMGYFVQIVQNFPLKGKYSIRKRPIVKIDIIARQDESMCFLYALNNDYWSVEGHMPQRSKSEVAGIMIFLVITH